MVQLISSLSAAVAAATLLRIVDVKEKNGLDLAHGACMEFTPVQSFPSAQIANQEWILAGGPFTYQIVAANCGTFLTFPGAGSPIAIRSQTTTRSFPASSWNLTLANAAIPTGPWNIIEASSNTALTVWDQDPAFAASGTPITLETPNPNDTRQQFWFVVV
ncbi:hypothetical protein FB451DRAFT_1285378 [Mycena latifolia]|nr:hypothetical protein FB451DRAFT_1285378 [Mycena latifolia]